LYFSVGIIHIWFTWKHEQTNTENSNKDDNPPFKRQAGTNKIEFIALVTENTRNVITFMGPCIVRIFKYVSNKMQRYTVYFYLETALHISGGTTIHHQECKQLYLQHLVFVTPLLLPAVIVEELELV
jgi:hypothetical protein